MRFVIFLPEPPELVASRNAMAATIANAPAQAPFKCHRCNRVHRAQALRSLVISAAEDAAGATSFRSRRLTPICRPGREGPSGDDRRFVGTTTNDISVVGGSTGLPLPLAAITHRPFAIRVSDSLRDVRRLRAVETGRTPEVSAQRQVAVYQRNTQDQSHSTWRCDKGTEK